MVDRNLSFSDLVDAWLVYKSKSQGCSDATVLKYEGYLRKLGRFLDGADLDAVVVSRSELEEFTGMHLFRSGLGARSRRAVVAAVRGFFAWLQEHDIRRDNPASSLVYPKYGRPLPVAAQLADAEKILMQPDLDTFIGVRDAAMLSILIGSGLRVSGLIGLNESSLVFATDDKGNERLFLRVVEKGNKQRMVPTWHDSWLLVRAYLGHQELEGIDRTLDGGDKVLFVSMGNRKVLECDYIGEHRRLSPRSLHDRIVKYGEDAGLGKDIRHAHAFRHLFGTEMAEDSVDLLVRKALMGHASADTTEIYDNLAVRKLTKEFDRANPLRKIKTPATNLAKELMR